MPGATQTGTADALRSPRQAAGLLLSTSPVHSTHAIIIRQTRLTDTSLIVHWFTENHGLIKTVAKGARRPKSQFAGKLDLFFGGEIVFQQARKGELHALREVVIHDWREGLRGNYTSTLLAAYCCQLVSAAVELEHPDPGIHDLLQRALNHLNEAPPTMKALQHFEKELSSLLGVAHTSRSPRDSLGELIGRLPDSRDELEERLSP